MKQPFRLPQFIRHQAVANATRRTGNFLNLLNQLYPVPVASIKTYF